LHLYVIHLPQKLQNIFIIFQDEMKNDEIQRVARRKEQQNKRRKLDIPDPTPTEYKCDICGKVYSAKKSLIRHMRTHSASEKPPQFTCDQCEDKFTTRGQLTDHVYNKHSKKTYSCTICNVDFGKDRYKYHYHRTTFHKGTQVQGAGIPELPNRPFQRVVQVATPTTDRAASWTESDDPVSHWLTNTPTTTPSNPTSNPKPQRTNNRKRSSSTISKPPANADE